MAMTNPDSIPRYKEPAFDELLDDDFDEVVSCEHCGHCFPITDSQCKLIWSHMNPYGRWHKREGEVRNAMRHALKCFGVCETKGELVELADLPCDHFWDGE